VVSEVVSAVVGHKTLGVDEVELVPRLLFREAAACVECHYLLGDTDTSGSRTHKDQLLIFDRNPGEVDSAHISERC
jgi:hypothetical protein